MPTNHTVQQGECLSSIARRYGFSRYQTIYDHPENTELKRRRPNPNVIYPGDVLFIPDRELGQSSHPTNQRHNFQLRRQPVMLRVCVRDDQHQPYANTRYRLRVGDQTWEDTTDGQGKLEKEIPPDAQEGELTIFPAGSSPQDPGYSFPLSIGELDPIGEVSGVQGRLGNLGFDCGPADGIAGERTQAALRDFQARFGLRQSGEIDQATRNKLRELHDGE